MKDAWNAMMAKVTRLTQSGRLREATAAIQRALRGGAPATPRASGPARREADPQVIDAVARVVSMDGALDDGDVLLRPPPPQTKTRERPVDFDTVVETPAVELDGEFVTGSYTNSSGRRDYKLYIPSGPHTQPLPLIVMLHGCKQNPDDFAAGTRMNQLAERERFFVLYPAQTKSANGMGCWNWFRGRNQQRDLGEPSIIAGMTHEIIASYPIDARHVHVAGLSAGGAMAAIMASTYPELYAAVGVHSGLPHGAAHDVMSAFAAMRDGPSAARARAADAGEQGEQRALPTIVFHGDQDATVHPGNGDHVIALATAAPADTDIIGAVAADASFTVERGQMAGGHAYSRTIYRDAHGRSTGVEHWVVHGAGHAWSGGSAKGSYTDPKGPDASREMLRFFREHPLPT